MKKSILSAFLTSIMVSGLVLVGSLPFDTVQATDVIGIINSDTMWTKANSPYILTGPVGVAEGVTLTIEAGVTVNGKGIEVNGTLVARGNSVDLIHFNGVNIIFTQSSSSWNEQTGSGSIIENAIFNGSTEISINNTSPKINSNYIYGNLIVGYEGAPIISNNIIVVDYYIAIQTGRGSTLILNNTIIINHDNYGISADGPVSLDTPPPVILNNTIKGGRGKIGITAGTVYIFGNVVSGFQTGIYASGSATIEKSLIINNDLGIDDGWGSNVIRNNTIANNSVAIFSQGPYSSTISYNNIHDNSNFNIQLHSYKTSDVDATYNWWGTTDVAKINQSIYDFKKDFNLGTVAFVPFLTAPNPQAPAMTIITTTPTPSPSSSSSPSPSQNPTEPNVALLAVIAVLLGIIAVLLIVVIAYLRNRSAK